MVAAILLCVARRVLADPPVAAVVTDLPAGDQPALVEVCRQSLRQAGYQVRAMPADALVDGKGLASCQLLLIPNGPAAPLAAIPAVEKYLNSGGKMIVCGLPLWGEAVLKADGQWLTQAARQAKLDAIRPARVLPIFSEAELPGWRHNSDAGPAGTQWKIVDDGGKGLEVTVPKLTGWDNLSRPISGAFPAGHSLTCFRAKGSPGTSSVMVEWAETDGSRWIAAVTLTPQWRNYVLKPEAFQAWLPPAGRGGPNDHLRAGNVAKLSIGLALSHGGLTPGSYQYTIADLGTAADPFANLPGMGEVPHLESLCPGYQLFPSSGTSVVTAAEASWMTSARLPAPAKLLGIVPRPQGDGLNKNRVWRWQPLQVAQNQQGQYRGTTAALCIPLVRNLRGAAWAAFTSTDGGFYQQPAMRQTMTEVAKSLARGVFLQEGGAKFYTLFENQPVELGAKVMSLVADVGGGGEYAVRLRITPAAGGHTVYERTWQIKPQLGAPVVVSDTWTAPAVFPGGGYMVTTELLAEGQVVDRLSHELNQWRPPAKPQFIQARDGGLWLNDKPWKAHGVNYMPSSGIGLNNGRLFEYWNDAAAYDPRIIQRDLELAKAMNLNSISIFLYHSALPSQNMLDLLRRCRDLGLKVNLSLRPGTPLNFPAGQVKEMIQKLHLAENDTVFAYDLAWEPSHFDHAHQTRYAADWRKWVQGKYGSLEAAQQAWGVAGPKETGQFGVPPAKQLTTDGPWRKMVVDYRRFLDEYLGKHYADARTLVRQVDPNHAVSFRMQFAGDPTFNQEHLLPYEFRGLTDAVDIWEPEAYGRIGDWPQVRPGMFTASYARLCDPKKPIVWAEMGMSVWDMSSMSADAKRLAFQADYYRDFYRMMRLSGADGVFFWWLPGGYRANEKSDFGIVNADGSDRPATAVIRQEAAAFLNAPKPAGPAQVIKVSPDADARGLYGIYQAVSAEYWQAVEQGKVPVLQWANTPN